MRSLWTLRALGAAYGPLSPMGHYCCSLRVIEGDARHIVVHFVVMVISNRSTVPLVLSRAP